MVGSWLSLTSAYALLVHETTYFKDNSEGENLMDTGIDWMLVTNIGIVLGVFATLIRIWSTR